MVVLGINTGEQAQQARQFRDKHRLTYPILLDNGGQVSQKYGVSGIPQNVVIDRRGIVRLVEVGFDPGTTRIGQTIDSLLKG